MKKDYESNIQSFNYQVVSSQNTKLSGIQIINNKRLVAYEELPIELFYNNLNNYVNNKAFNSFVVSDNKIVVYADFTDRVKNSWTVILTVRTEGTNGFSGTYQYKLNSGTAKNVFLMHLLTLLHHKKTVIF